MDMNMQALSNISYGLYVLTTRENDKDNGCIINTVQQVTSSPCVISVTVNKENYSHAMLMNTGEFNVSCISIDTGFDVFEKFGFVSGKDTDKFANWEDAERSENGLYYLTKGVNSYLSGQIFHSIDLGTHTMFLAKVTAMESLSEDPSLTYAYYHRHIKPKPKAEEKNGYRCIVCGYVYEGEELPPDFVCPWCKHGVEDFEKI